MLKEKIKQEFCMLRDQIIEAQYDHLNDMQKKAVLSSDGPVLILAGAGSGKTTVLINRISHLVRFGNAYKSHHVPEDLRQEDLMQMRNFLHCSASKREGMMPHRITELIEKWGVYPGNILAITFTNKAAKEMKERAEALLGRTADLWISTFHSACVKILRRDIDKLGYTRDFVIYDAADQKVILKECLKELNIHEDLYPLAMVQHKIGQAKDSLLTPQKYMELYASDFQLATIGKIYERYQYKLKKNNALDFDDLIFKTVELFEKNPMVLKDYQHKFQYIMVDEYQDTNQAQYKLVSMLAAKHKNLCVVGDDDQSIYSWRGADIRNILNFEDDFSNATVIKLEQNYRSTQRILDAANCVIQNNVGRKRKMLWTSNKKGEQIQYYGAMNEHDEAQFIVDQIQHLISAEGRSYSEFAVLYRTNAQSRVLEEMLMKAGIPYRIFGGLKFYDRKEIKDIIAYLRLIQNPVDDVSLKRVINVPKRGIGDRTIEKIEKAAQQTGESLFSVLLDEEWTKDFSRRVLAGIKDFVLLIAKYGQLKDTIGVTTLIEKVLEESGYIEELKREGTIEARARMENLQEFLTVAMDFENNNEVNTLEEFLANISLMSDIDKMDDDENTVVLMTLHSAKGLEFPVVFLAGVEEGLFPISRAMLNERDLEEERRLCYVGITRAKEKLFISHAKVRTIYGRTSYNPMSRFIEEMGDHLMDIDKKNTKEKENSVSFPGIYRGMTLEQKPKVMGNISNHEIKPGSKVKHDKFGTGTVITIKGSGEKAELTIAFDNAGIKRLVLGYAPIKLVHS